MQTQPVPVTTPEAQSPRLVVVINNREALELVQRQPIGKDLRGVPILGDLVTLLPGVNLIAPNVLAELRKNPQFDSKFTAKIPPSLAPEQSPERVGRPILEIMVSVGNKGEIDAATPTFKLAPDQAAAMVAETFSTAMLRVWLTTEQRGPVRQIIEAQVAKLTGDPHGPASAGR